MTRLTMALLLLLLMLCSSALHAERLIATDDGDQIPVAVYPAEGGRLLRHYATQRQAPALRLPVLDGGQIDLGDLRGKVVLVNFWETWCPPCVEEIPSLQQLCRRLRPQGLEILAVDVGESPATMRKFLENKPTGFPVLMDTRGEALRRRGIYAFPTTLVLDRSHRIRYAVFGAFDSNSAEVTDALTPLLAADGPVPAQQGTP